jgi:hypothetical protein
VKLLAVVGSRTPGSDEQKTQMLVQMKSMVVNLGCPSIYLTINPGDRHSPFVLRFAGESIDPFDFHPSDYTSTERLRTALANPHAVNEYFDTMMHLLVRCVFAGGLFGRLVAHFGVKEFQGRGSPHAHLLVYRMCE